MAKSSESLPAGHRAERYWVESRRPLASLVFLAPLLIVYEAGVLLLGAQNGADAFLRRGLEMLGFGQHFVLPLLMVCILLAWHHLAREPWRLSAGIISGMAVESLALGICLRVILFLQDMLFRLFEAPAALSIGGQAKVAVGLLGAGIYEELLFRLILLWLAAWALRRTGIAPRAATVAAAILTSLLFAAAHNVGPYGEPLEAFRFLFRVVAGLFFAAVFLYRGFGIAAGSHAAYDILAWFSG
jgi:membrane protease YdiL (CAAX protease family)